MKYATFVYFFTFPVTPQQYLDTVNDLELQKKIDTYMD